jgi:hypothetical protein
MRTSETECLEALREAADTNGYKPMSNFDPPAGSNMLTKL